MCTIAEMVGIDSDSVPSHNSMLYGKSAVGSVKSAVGSDPQQQSVHSQLKNKVAVIVCPVQGGGNYRARQDVQEMCVCVRDIVSKERRERSDTRHL